MVAYKVGDVAVPDFAIWYNEGDIAEIECKKEKDTSAMSEEERLLWALFHSTKEYRIPKAGFYKITSDYGVDEEMEDGAFAGCTKMAVPFGEDIYFAEKPLVPEGFLSEEQDSRRMDAEIKNIKAKRVEESIDKIQVAAKEDTVIGETLKCMIKDRPISDKEIIKGVYKNGSCDVSTLEIGETLIDANNLISKLAEIIKGEGGIETLEDNLHKAVSSNAHVRYFDGLLIKYGLNEYSKTKRYILMCLNDLCADGGFYYYRYHFTKQKKYGDIAHTLIAAYTARTFMIRLVRCARLKLLDVPHVIMINELRMLANIIIEFVNVSRLEIDEERFPAMYGIYVDGTEYEGKCWIGNRERLLENEDEEETDSSDEEELPDLYIVVDAPNYTYQDGFYALWNPKLGRYYRADNEHVTVFKTIKEAKSERDKIDKKK